MDNLTKRQRKKNMANIKRVNTAVELKFRRFVWSKDLRGYKTDYNKVAGRPDLYFTKQNSCR